LVDSLQIRKARPWRVAVVKVVVVVVLVGVSSSRTGKAARHQSQKEIDCVLDVSAVAGML